MDDVPGDRIRFLCGGRPSRCCTGQSREQFNPFLGWTARQTLGSLDLEAMSSTMPMRPYRYCMRDGPTGAAKVDKNQPDSIFSVLSPGRDGCHSGKLSLGEDAQESARVNRPMSNSADRCGTLSTPLPEGRACGRSRSTTVAGSTPKRLKAGPSRTGRLGRCFPGLTRVARGGIPWPPP
jgi:hypothetical protein